MSYSLCLTNLNPLCEERPHPLRPALPVQCRSHARSCGQSQTARSRGSDSSVSFIPGAEPALHPHVHCVVPAGGLSPDHRRWVHPKYAFFLPVDALSVVFRARFVDGLRKAYRQRKLVLSGPTAELRNPERFHAFVDSLFRQKWVVYAKQAFGGPTQVIRYPGRYTHRVAISNHRLLAFDGRQITFRWKDYAHGNKQRKMTLQATEFLRRFTQHILPRGFVRIRQFGYLANNRRSELLSLARQFLAANIPTPAVCPSRATDHSVWRCPECNGEMQIGPNLSARQLASRCKPLDSSQTRAHRRASIRALVRGGSMCARSIQHCIL